MNLDMFLHDDCQHLTPDEQMEALSGWHKKIKNIKEQLHDISNQVEIVHRTLDRQQGE